MDNIILDRVIIKKYQNFAHETTENPCVASSILAWTTIWSANKPFSKGFFVSYFKISCGGFSGHIRGVARRLGC
jgi:hypothetical protein